MDDKTEKDQEQELSYIRNVSLPRIHERLDDICSNVGKLLTFFEDMRVWKVQKEMEIQPLLGLHEKHTIISGKVENMSKIMWAIGGVLLTGIVGLCGWLFNQIVNKVS